MRSWAGDKTLAVLDQPFLDFVFNKVALCQDTETET